MSDAYYELIIEGPFILVKGFIEGFLAASDRAGRAVYNRESSIERTSTRERILRWLSMQEESCHVILHERDVAGLEEATAATEKIVGLKVLSRRRIREACFGFEFRVYSKPHGAALKDIVTSPPEGLRFENYRQKLEEDDSARGAEAYAPLHHFTFEGSGRAVGSFERVFWMRRKLEELATVELGRIGLEFEDEDPA